MTTPPPIPPWGKDFLAALNAGHGVKKAAAIAGKSTSTIYKERKNNATFARAWDGIDAERKATAEIARRGNRDKPKRREARSTPKQKDGKKSAMARARELMDEIRAFIHQRRDELTVLAYEQGAPPDWPDLFLVAFAELGNVKIAAELAGVHRDTVYKRRAADKDFAKRMDLAKEDAVDALDFAARMLALEQGGPLLIYLLKCHGGPKYNPPHGVRHAGFDGGPVKSEGKVEHSGGLDLNMDTASEIMAALAEAGVIEMEVEDE